MNLHPLKTNAPRLLPAAMALMIIAGAAACGTYRLGSSLPADIKTVFIPVFTNETDEPLIENEVTRDVISRIQREGALKVVPEAEADAVLKVALKRFDFRPIAYDNANRDRPNEYRMILCASFVLYRRSNGEVLAEHPSSQGETLVQIAGDMSTSKRQGLPDASKDLARDLTDKILESW